MQNAIHFISSLLRLKAIAKDTFQYGKTKKEKRNETKRIETKEKTVQDCENCVQLIITFILSMRC